MVPFTTAKKERSINTYYASTIKEEKVKKEKREMRKEKCDS